MISIDNIELNFGERELFKGISFLINPKDRIGLVGKNGSGKSTLLKIITGEARPDSGNVVVPGDTSIGYLPQHMNYKDETSVVKETEKAFSEINYINREIEKLNKKISDAIDYNSEEYLKNLDNLAHLNERLNILDEGSRDEKIERCLTGLGFLKDEFNRNTSELSGGWRMRIEIAKLLIKNPDVLLLDEPTNHLDIESIQWLETFLKDYNGSVVLISHDRAFLDNITKRTVEISLGKIYDYNVPYSKFTELKKERHEQQLAAYRNQQKLIEDTEKFIERFRYKATKAVQVQSRIKQLEKIERIEVDEVDSSSFNIKFPPAPRSGKVVVEAEDLIKSYDSKLVLDKINIIIERGEKVAFVGKNGEGKTTLSRIIMNELDFQGVLKVGHNIKTGYFAQNQDKIMNENLSVFETIDAVAVGDIRTKIRDILGAFLFSGEDIEKKVKVLSGGERSRLALAKLLLEPYNLLVLDEPTNHLDLHSKDLLKEALKKYDGTLIIVSHDRYFLDGLIDKIYEFGNKKVKEHLGGIYEFLQRKKINTLSELEVNYSTKKENIPEKIVSGNKESYLEKKELEKKLRKVRRMIEESEDKIDLFENRLKELNRLLSKPELLNNEGSDSIYKEYDDIQKQLNEEMKNWQLYNEQYAGFEQDNN